MSGYLISKKNSVRAGVRTSEAGVSLLEVMVAMVLTLLLIESLLQLMLVGMNGIALAGQRTTACAYADSLLEEMKARPEMLNGLSEHAIVRAVDLPFSVPIPPGVETYIRLAPLDGLSTLYEVQLKVISTRGSRQWEENLIGLVPAPAE